jgi:hypothetical protein
MSIDLIEDPAFYQNVFTKIDKIRFRSREGFGRPSLKSYRDVRTKAVKSCYEERDRDRNLYPTAVAALREANCRRRSVHAEWRERTL